MSHGGNSRGEVLLCHLVNPRDKWLPSGAQWITHLMKHIRSQTHCFSSGDDLFGWNGWRQTEERTELWHHPQPFLLRIRTKQREQGEEGRADKEMRQEDVQYNETQKAEKMNKLELQRKIKQHSSKVISVKFDKENNSLPHLLLMSENY